MTSSAPSLVSTYRDIVSTASHIKNLFKDFNLPDHSPSTPIEFDSLPEPADLSARLRVAGAPDAVIGRLNDAYSRAALKLRKASEDRLRVSLRESSKYSQFTKGPSNVEWRTKFIATFKSQYTQKLASLADGVISQVGERFRAVEDCGSSDRQKKLTFNSNYLPVLETYFVENAFPSKTEKNLLAEKSGMSYRQIHVWFQNKRNRAKKAGEGSHTIQMKPASDKEHTDVEDDSNMMLDCSSRSSSVTLAGIDDIFAKSTPAYAFPSVYPPEFSEDPFPCRFGDFSGFPKLSWTRKPATQSLPPNFEEDAAITSLVVAFQGLSIGDKVQHQLANDACRLPWGLYVPVGKTGCDVTAPYTIRPLRAPLFSFIRKPTQLLAPRPCEVTPKYHRQKKELSSVSVTPGFMEVVNSTHGSQRQPLPAARPIGQGLAASVSRTCLFSSSIASIPTSSTDASLGPKRASRKKTGLKGRAPSGHGKGKGKGRSKAATSSQSSIRSKSPSSDTSSRSPSFDSDSSLPPLSYSSSSSSASSDTHSPVTVLQSLPEEKSLPQSNSLGSTDTSLLLPPAQSLLEVFPPPVFASDDNNFPFDFSKGPLDYTFNYDLPPYPTFSQPLDGFSQGLHFSPFFATSAPLSFDFNAISV